MEAWNSVYSSHSYINFGVFMSRKQKMELGAWKGEEFCYRILYDPHPDELRDSPKFTRFFCSIEWHPTRDNNLQNGWRWRMQQTGQMHVQAGCLHARNSVRLCEIPHAIPLSSIEMPYSTIEALDSVTCKDKDPLEFYAQPNSPVLWWSMPFSKPDFRKSSAIDNPPMLLLSQINLQRKSIGVVSRGETCSE